MIPKIIHFCWFGKNPLPYEAIKCIESWKKFFPDYEIKEWNETNFDCYCCDYISEAYEKGKWAFVSDYARFKILYEYGGIYFDTDVEVIKNFDDIIENGGFMGCEASSKLMNFDSAYNVAAGLGLGVEPQNAFYKEILDYYNNQHFILPNGTINPTTVVVRVTKILKEHGFVGNGDIENIEGITIYPPDYFCPLNNDTGELLLTNNSHSIHYYSSSWYTETQKKYQAFLRNNVKKNKIHTLKNIILGLGYRIKFNIEVLGVKGVLLKLYSKFRSH